MILDETVPQVSDTGPLVLWFSFFVRLGDKQARYKVSYSRYYYRFGKRFINALFLVRYKCFAIVYCLRIA